MFLDDPNSVLVSRIGFLPACTSYQSGSLNCNPPQCAFKTFPLDAGFVKPIRGCVVIFISIVVKNKELQRTVDKLHKNCMCEQN